jgi:uncharacterized protein
LYAIRAMDIQRQEHRNKGAFFIDEDGEWVAELTYTRTGENTIVIDHTEVDEKLRGENIGEDLVAAAVEYARQNGLKVKATCPYAKKVLAAKADYQDILA